MPANRYEFVDVWNIPHPADVVWEVLARPSRFPEWWRGVYLKAELVGGDGEPSVGSRVAVVAKGWLPYKLKATFEATRLEKPNLIEFKAEGDFKTDSSRWIIRESSGGTQATLEWNPIVDQAFVRAFSFLLKPLFRSNHRWTMKRGEKQIAAYIASKGQADSPGMLLPR